jgi:DNA-binding NarL/FixJ family response regulator
VIGAVTDGRAAADAAIGLQPDLVVLDIGMSELDGLSGQGIAAPRVKHESDFLDGAGRREDVARRIG